MKVIILVLSMLACHPTGCGCSHPSPPPAPAPTVKDAAPDVHVAPDVAPVDAAVAKDTAPADGGGAEQCFDNLCGMDSYCSCHGDGLARRCWSLSDDCKFDAQCCYTNGGCQGMRSDDCVTKTIDYRRQQMKKSVPR